MPKGPKGEKRPADVIGAAIMVAKIATGEIEEKTVSKPAKRAEAVALGRAGGKKRAENMTPEQRKEVAQKAAKARWATRLADVEEE